MKRWSIDSWLCLVTKMFVLVTRDKNTKIQPVTSVLSQCWLPSNNTRRQEKKNDNTKSPDFKNTTSFHHWGDTAQPFLKSQTGYCVKKQEALQTRKRPKIRAENDKLRRATKSEAVWNVWESSFHADGAHRGEIKSALFIHNEVVLRAAKLWLVSNSNVDDCPVTEVEQKKVMDPQS